jgi:hypothetical protein
VRRLGDSIQTARVSGRENTSEMRPPGDAS